MIIGKKNFLILFSAVFLLLGGARPMSAAEFDDTTCQYFSPAFVLCSVHSHNIGLVENAGSGKPANPTDAEQIADMNEVIAAKSTVIAQQLKKQYDALNAVIKRFKTQLEKAVLTSKMEMITGNISSSSGGGSSSYNSAGNTGLAGAQDCDAVSYAQAYDCIIGNLQKIQNTNDARAAREQFNKDIQIANDLGLCNKGSDGKTAKCGETLNTTNLKETKETANTAVRKLRAAKNQFDNANSRPRSPWY